MTTRTTKLRDAAGHLSPYRTTEEANLTPLATTKSIYGNSSTKRVNLGTALNAYFERDRLYSINFWAKITTANATENYAMANWQGGGNLGFCVGASLGVPTSLTFYLGNNVSGNNLRVKGATNIKDSTWRMLTVTYAGTSLASGVQLYVNSVIEVKTVLSDTLSASALSTTNLGFLGNPSEATTYLAGWMCVCSMYNRVLSQDEITGMYHAGKPVDGRKWPGCFAFWRCGDNDQYPVIREYVGGYHGAMTNMSASDIAASAP